MMDDFVGRTLGGYKLEVMLGKGGMATVYRAYQTSVKRFVAIKVMSPEIADQPGFVERFSREAEVIASLEHPHILPVIDYGTDSGIHYLVMRFIEGGSLDDRMRRESLTLQYTARLISQIASALNYAHDRGVIHRDMKPNNVLLDKQENAYITDFGIARLVQSEHKLTSTGSVLGTPAYMAPEQAMGQPVDSRADIYTLGVMLYEMVLNRLPFVADTPVAMIFQHVHEKPADPAVLNPNLPRTVIDVLNRAMAKNPDDRFQSANELASAFSEAVAGRASATPVLPPDAEGTFVGGPMTPLPVTPTKPGTSSPPRPPTLVNSPSTVEQTRKQTVSRSFPIPLVIGIVVVLLIIAGAFFVINSNNNNAAIAAQQTQTQAAIVVASATLAITNTAVVTAAPTGTATQAATLAASSTRTRVPTITPNLTRTAFAQRANATASAKAKASNTPLPSATKQNTTSDNGTEAVIAQLVEDGYLTNDSGGVILSADKIDLLVDKPDWSIWMPIEKSADVFNFVVSADITWDAPDENNECGFVLRYTPGNGEDENWTFYIVTIHREGNVKAWVRHEDGYEDDPIFDEEADAIDTANRATNQLQVIAQEDTFKIFVNGDYVGEFSDDSFASGRVEVFGTRFAESKGLVCKFRDVWVWQIE